MNARLILRVTGKILILEGFLLWLPLIVNLIYRESFFWSFMGPSLGLLAAGGLLQLVRVRSHNLYAKEGLFITALAWLLMSLFGCLPFMLSGEIPVFWDAFFEMVSGFTTTGATVVSDVEAMSHGILFWRSFSHWIGGMGILVFVLAVLPQTGGGTYINLMRAESPGPQVGKLVSKVRFTARILYGIYIVMTLIQIVFLLCGRMPLFDSLITAFGTAGTGGFSCLNNSIAGYDSLYIEIVVTVFMLLFGVNFNFFYLLLIGHFGEAFRCEEVRWYFIIVLFSMVVIALNTLGLYGDFWTALRYSSFQVASIITTTGFATWDFALWPTFSKTVLIVLMIIGACAGSTGGGIKVCRLVIAGKTMNRELKLLSRPRSVVGIKFEGKTLDPAVLRGVQTFLAVYMGILFASFLVVSLDGLSLEATFSAVVTTLGNVGPGLAEVGPMSNFSAFSPLSKLVMSFNMLAGRLELFPILLLFAPSTYIKRA